MPADLADIGARYLDHLTEPDLRRLAATAEDSLDSGDLRFAPARVIELLRRPATYDALLAVTLKEGPLAVLSPFLVLAAAVHRGTAEVQRTGRLPEWTGKRQRLPLLVDRAARDFLTAPGTSLFLTELLASFTHIDSGSYLVRTGGGWRRRRWTELDPIRLAGLLEAVPATERAGVYRRLGDSALFLTGVFPDATSGHGLSAVDAQRLLRLVPALPDAAPPTAPVALLEYSGAQWYRRAVATATTPTASTTGLLEIADRFADARRLLTLIADRYLFPGAQPWFTAG